ncbi:PspC domain-containing protein [Clostridium sp. Marseille-P2415]|uniref:PspC domain-containing protein n=1 Tax=Clostridium sp. Marseille-P2415 TaxID=1805471 RepID=UPI0009886760|nr:PspC domain-containing protein [Clostridium sp. Marseille-P2415]
MKKKLYRSKHSRVLLGLCGGLGEFFDIDPIIIRLIFLFSGIGIVAYFILCCFIPENPMLP